MIHTFGDSHSDAGWCAIKGVHTHPIGPLTCHRVGRDGLDAVNITGKVQPGDIAIFCFGEIDCRCHVGKFVTEGIMDFANITVGNYFKTLQQNAEANPEVTIGVLTVTPASKKNGLKEAPDFPFIGTDEERASYVVCFNVLYRLWCKKLGFICVDVHSQYSDGDGMLNSQYSTDGVHITNPVFIIGELKRLGIMP